MPKSPPKVYGRRREYAQAFTDLKNGNDSPFLDEELPLLAKAIAEFPDEIDQEIREDLAYVEKLLSGPLDFAVQQKNKRLLVALMKAWGERVHSNLEGWDDLACFAAALGWRVGYRLLKPHAMNPDGFIDGIDLIQCFRMGDPEVFNPADNDWEVQERAFRRWAKKNKVSARAVEDFLEEI